MDIFLLDIEVLKVSKHITVMFLLGSRLAYTEKGNLWMSANSKKMYFWAFLLLFETVPLIAVAAEPLTPPKVTAQTRCC